MDWCNARHEQVFFEHNTICPVCSLISLLLEAKTAAGEILILSDKITALQERLKAK